MFNVCSTLQRPRVGTVLSFSFSVAATVVWNLVDSNTVSAETFLVFKCRLLRQGYNTWQQRHHYAPDSPATGNGRVAIFLFDYIIRTVVLGRILCRYPFHAVRVYISIITMHVCDAAQTELKIARSHYAVCSSSSSCSCAVKTIEPQDGIHT